jgi:tRNA (guanine10-N2)-dimethyltransferase
VLCVEFSKENRTLAIAEIARFCHIHEVYSDIVLCEGRSEELGRLAYAKVVNEILFICDEEDVPDRVSCLAYERFSVRVFNAGDRRMELERVTGSRIRGSVDLKYPQNEIRIFLEGPSAVVCRKLFSIREDFESRRATLRPFFSPTSLHPRLARAMVNLSGARREVLDPFCGTGGVLIEAGLIGLEVYGFDIQQSMVEGCKINLEHFGIRDYFLSPSDIGDVPLECVEAIVTDMPYGKSSFMAKEPITDLYARSFRKFHELLAEGKRAVVCSNRYELLKLAGGFRIESLHYVYVNKSMNRWIASFIRI